MPLMRPEITRALEEIGLSPKRSGDKKEINERLEEAGLGLDSILENLASMANSAESEHLRLRANETALRMHGVLTPENQGPTTPVVKIVIESSTPVDMGFLQPPSEIETLSEVN